jgi:hypothetical protein
MGLFDYTAMVLAVGVVATTLGVGAVRLRARLVPGWSGAPARLAEAVLGFSALVVALQALGIAGVLGLWETLVACAVLGAAMAILGTNGRRRLTTAREWIRPGPVCAIAIVLWLVVLWAGPVLVSLHRGIVDGDSLWYHLPFAARFAQDSSITGLQFDGPYYLSWFYPANTELVHAFGILAAGDHDVLSALISLVWLALAALAAWCIARPFGVGPAGVAAVALLLGSALIVGSESGAARSDLAAIAFMLAAAGVLVNGSTGSVLHRGAVPITGLATGLAVGSKLTLLPAAAVIFAGVVLLSRDSRRRAAGVWAGGAVLTGGFWYLRNVVYAGNPLPWLRLGIGPVTLASSDPDPAAQYRFSFLHYVLNARVWREYYVPGLHEGLGALWPVVLALAAAGAMLGIVRGSPAQRILGMAALVSAVAYVVNPMSAPGPEGSPSQFDTNLRYLAPALALGLVLVPTAMPSRLRATRWLVPPLVVLLLITGARPELASISRGRMGSLLVGTHMGAAYRWARGIRDTRIATTSVLVYGLMGDDLSNRVLYVGIAGPHGTFTDATTCRQWRGAVDAGDFDFLVLAPAYQGTAPPVPRGWVRSPNAHEIMRSGPTTVFSLSGPLKRSRCSEARVGDV